MSEPRKVFVLYDSRAVFEGTDEATVIDTAGSEREARHAGKTTWKGYHAIWAEYDLIRKEDGQDWAENEILRYDLPPTPPQEPRP